MATCEKMPEILSLPFGTSGIVSLPVGCDRQSGGMEAVEKIAAPVPLRDISFFFNCPLFHTMYFSIHSKAGLILWAASINWKFSWWIRTASPLLPPIDE